MPSGILFELLFSVSGGHVRSGFPYLGDLVGFCREEQHRGYGEGKHYRDGEPAFRAEAPAVPERVGAFFGKRGSEHRHSVSRAAYGDSE